MELFELYRVSILIAEGVVFDSGRCALTWVGEHNPLNRNISVLPSFKDVLTWNPSFVKELYVRRWDAGSSEGKNAETGEKLLRELELEETTKGNNDTE